MCPALLLCLPPMFRTLGQSPLLNCTNRKFLVPKTDNFDSEGNLIFINTIGGETPQDAKARTPVGSLFNTLCQAAAATAATDVAGTYKGMITMTFKRAEQRRRKRFQLLSRKPQTMILR
jgi:hypothetical protein